MHIDKLNFRNFAQRQCLLTHVIVVMLSFCLGSKIIYADVSNKKSSDSALLITMMDKNWQLKSISKSGKDVFELGKKVVTLSFDSTCKVSGRSVINRYFGHCELGDKGAIKWIGPGFGMTMMAGPPEEMEAEKLYLEHLKQTTKIILKDSLLELQSDDGNLRLVFEIAL